MGFVESGRVIKKVIYDALEGKYVREVKSRDIFILSGSTIKGSSTFPFLATGSVAAEKEILITSMVFMASDTDVRFDVTAGTSTLFRPIALPDEPLVLTTGVDAPFARIGGTTVITIDADFGSGTSTISAFITGVVHPKFEYLETK